MMKNLIANSSQINKKRIHKIILDNFDDLAPFYYKMLSRVMIMTFIVQLFHLQAQE